MTYSEITQNIYTDNKKIYKKGKMRIGILLFSACLCLCILGFGGLVIFPIYEVIKPYATAVMPETTYELIFNMAFYVISIVLPFSITMIVCRTGFKTAFPLKPKLVRNPIAFILFAFGICLLFNMILSYLMPWYSELFPTDDFLYESRTDIVLYFIQVAILPAIIEEFVFRGIAVNALRPMGTKFAVVFSAILFGMAHLNPLQSAFATLFGLLLGGVYVATGSVWTCVLLHFFNNAFAVIVEYSVAMADKGNIFLLLGLNMLAYGAIAYSIVYLVKYIRLPGRFTMAVKEEKESMLTGSGFTPARAVFTNFWTYAFVIIYIAIVVLLIIANQAGGSTV